MSLRPLLLPLTPLYRLGLALRERRLASGREPIRRLRFPVISIGNLSTGGAGKTPLTIALAQALTARAASLAESEVQSAPAGSAPPQVAVDVLSRGYGRHSIVASRVDPNGSADDYGDEPLLIARAANVPVFVAPNRYDAGLLAESSESGVAQGDPSGRKTLREGTERQGTTFSRADHDPKKASGFSPCPTQLHLLDDGFQHRQLHRDLDILLLSRADLNDHLLPAGNLREPLQAASRAHIIAIPANDPTLESALRALGFDQPIWRLHRRMQVPPNLAGKPVLAFCGIARPNQFFAGLEQAGLTLADRAAFPDHHRYTPRDLQTLAAKARATGATSFLTTEKDAIRLRSLHSPLPILTVPHRTEIEDAPAALNYLFDRLNITPPRG